MNGTDTVREYNVAHAGKAWAIMGMTVDGDIYCADCAAGWPLDESPVDDSPMPVFASDDYVGMSCGKCLATVGE